MDCGNPHEDRAIAAEQDRAVNAQRMAARKQISDVADEMQAFFGGTLPQHAELAANRILAWSRRLKYALENIGP